MVTVPTPAGFTPVLQGNGYVPKIKGREVIPRAVTASSVVRYSIAGNAQTQVIKPTQYSAAVTCVKVLAPYTTVTSTATAPTRTTTLLAVVSTKTNLVSTTSTVTQVPPEVTATQTITSTATVDQNAIVTTTTVETTKTGFLPSPPSLPQGQILTHLPVTETVVAPAPTYYAACGSDNLATTANGGYTISGVGISGRNYQVPANSAYDCCAACQASNCKVSLWFGAAYPSGVCYNSYDDTCRPGSVTDYFYTYSDNSYGYDISNGPCGAYENGGNYPSGY
ncbi:MAG: hypothetical protein L6R40_006710 [Gallowayella cf. fulva]|nr:MAG: hypothetical protein L6R40_006710 [Xanthomendoza cf. fulva]